MRCLDAIFDDKRLSISLLMVWLVGSVFLLQTLDLMHSDFMTLGPSAHSRFMTLSIDTWHKWAIMATATFANTCVSDFMSDAIMPWIQNTVQDHKTKYLPYNKFTCYMISQLWNVYCGIMSIFSISLMTSQIDFLLIRMLADLITSTFTTYKFMRHKVVDRIKYSKWSEDYMQEQDPLVDLQDAKSEVGGDQV
jgi:hypothetical protein